jgi:hypothetical protein
MLDRRPLLDDKQLQIVGAIWADDLTKAGIPPRRWDEVAGLARKFRSPSNKAFPITVDQMIDVWEEYVLRGKAWAQGDNGHISWQHQDRPRPIYCGDCVQGQIYGFNTNDQGDTRTSIFYCDCAIPQWVEPTYQYRRWCAAYEVATGDIYQPKNNTLRELHKILYDFTIETWDAEIRRYFATGPQNPSLGEFWLQSEVYARQRADEKRRRKEELRREEIRRQNEERLQREQEERERYEQERRQRIAAQASAVPEPIPEGCPF